MVKLFYPNEAFISSVKTSNECHVAGADIWTVYSVTAYSQLGV